MRILQAESRSAAVTDQGKLILQAEIADNKLSIARGKFTIHVLDDVTPALAKKVKEPEQWAFQQEM